MLSNLIESGGKMTSLGQPAPFRSSVRLSIHIWQSRGGGGIGSATYESIVSSTPLYSRTNITLKTQRSNGINNSKPTTTTTQLQQQIQQQQQQQSKRKTTRIFVAPRLCVHFNNKSISYYKYSYNMANCLKVFYL